MGPKGATGRAGYRVSWGSIMVATKNWALQGGNLGRKNWYHARDAGKVAGFRNADAGCARPMPSLHKLGIIFESRVRRAHFPVYSAPMDFSAGSAIRFGWETFKKRPWFFIGSVILIVIAYLVVGGITNAIDAALGGGPEEPTGVGSIVSMILGTFIGMGITAFSLAAHDSPETVGYGALWHPQPFWRYFAASILVSLAVVIGMLLLIIPGIILGLMFMFATYIVIDRGVGPIEAVKESSRITKGYKWSLFGFSLLLLLLNLLGLLALGVGLLVTVPVTWLAVANAYRVLGGRAVQDAVLTIPAAR
jgi:hypothetical protein